MHERNEGIRSGIKDVRRAAQALARQIPARLAPLARIAYNFHWVWHPDGERVFRAVDSYRWRLCRQNPVRFLQEASQESLERAASDLLLVRRVEALRNSLEEALARPACEEGVASLEHPIAFFCAEFGVHRSLPIYSGGLGVLAGDILKEASDRGLPMIGVGLMYRQGYFHQRVDAAGWQHEYWDETDPERRPCVLVTREDGGPLTVDVPIWDEEVSVNVWRVEVGRVPLFLLDTEVPGNKPAAALCERPALRRQSPDSPGPVCADWHRRYVRPAGLGDRPVHHPYERRSPGHRHHGTAWPGEGARRELRRSP